MIIKKVNRYWADCGRSYWTKRSCENHEKSCVCWTNPKHKTCKTCIFGKQVSDSNGMEHDPRYLETWMEWKCGNEKFIYDIHFKPAHEKAPDLCINCTLWQNKKQ